MTAIQTAAAARYSAEKDSKQSNDLEKSDQSLTNGGGPSKEEPGITAKETSYTPQSDEEYNVTFKTWIVVWVSRPSLTAIQTEVRRKDPSLVVRYLLLDCSDLQRNYDRHRYRARRSQQGCVVCASLHHVCNNGFHVSACLSPMAEYPISYLGHQGLRRQLGPFWPSMVHYRWECADVHWLHHCW